MAITRKEFLEMGAVAACAVLGATIACGEDGEAPSDMMSSGDCSANGLRSSIAGNHGHAFTVPAADLEAGVEKTYDIKGSSVHTHSITVTAASFSSLKQNQSITATTTSAGHTHEITLSCA